MEFEADRMTGLALTDDVVRPELNVVLEEQTCGSPTIPRHGSASRWTLRST